VGRSPNSYEVTLSSETTCFMVTVPELALRSRVQTSSTISDRETARFPSWRRRSMDCGDPLSARIPQRTTAAETYFPTPSRLTNRFPRIRDRRLAPGEIHRSGSTHGSPVDGAARSVILCGCASPHTTVAFHNRAGRADADQRLAAILWPYAKRRLYRSAPFREMACGRPEGSVAERRR